MEGSFIMEVALHLIRGTFHNGDWAVGLITNNLKRRLFEHSKMDQVITKRNDDRPMQKLTWDPPKSAPLPAAKRDTAALQ
jgi:hypothetical protein